MLLLSDQQRDPSESFFLTTVQHLFANLSVGSSNETVSAFWNRITADIEAFKKAKRKRSRPSKSGIARAVAHHKPIEDEINALNATLNHYLMPQKKKRAPLVAQAERFLSRFENLRLQMNLEFESLVFDRKDGTLSGGRIHPHVRFCTKELGTTDSGAWKASHHLVLNEARLTAIALSLFLAAVKLQDQVPYSPAPGEPKEPARLLVLDDVLIGLDYEHRWPVLDILKTDFLKAGRFQLILLTHNKEWFDLCRLGVGKRGWKHVEIYKKNEAGPSRSDYPMTKSGASDLVDRAKEFLDQDHEIPAAANYARTAIEWAMKEICANKHLPVPYAMESRGNDTDDFLRALTGKTGKRKRGSKVLRKALQTDLEALRKTVLNAYSHWHPTTAVEADVKRAIAVAEQLVKIARAG